MEGWERKLSLVFITAHGVNGGRGEGAGRGRMQVQAGRWTIGYRVGQKIEENQGKAPQR